MDDEAIVTIGYKEGIALLMLPTLDRGDTVLVLFFQAEDGIRDHCVTGVQTCALPISPKSRKPAPTAAGPGVKVRLQDEQRQSCTISSFFLRVPRRVRLRPPQWGQASGTLEVSGTRAMRGMGSILLIVCAQRTMHLTEIERRVHANWMVRTSRILLVPACAGRQVEPHLHRPLLGSCEGNRRLRRPVRVRRFTALDRPGAPVVGRIQ